MDILGACHFAYCRGDTFLFACRLTVSALDLLDQAGRKFCHDEILLEGILVIGQYEHILLEGTLGIG